MLHTVHRYKSFFGLSDFQTVGEDEQRDGVALSTQLIRGFNGVYSPNKTAVCRQQIRLQK